MNDRTIFKVLEQMGYADRDKTEFVDNFDRRFNITSVEITPVEKVVIIVVSKTVNGEKQSERYTFDLAKKTTNAKPEEIADLQKWLEIKPFDKAA